MQTKKPNNFNVPNALTLLRLLLIPVFIWLMFTDRMMPALYVFVFASLTDIADGWIARRYNLITDFGKLFDPLADKLMVLSVMASMAIKGIAPWGAIIVLLVKELLMMLGGVLLLRKKVVVYSMPIGKAAQFVTVAALVLCFFHEQFAAWGYAVHLWMLWTGVGLSILSLFYYAKLNGKKYFAEETGKADTKTTENRRR